MKSSRQHSWSIVALAGALAIALAAVFMPWVAVGIVCLGLLLGLLGGFGRIAYIFLGALGIVLIGYAVLGRGFAYLGVPPFFVGELVLLLGFLAFLSEPRSWRRPRDLISLTILLFMLWGFAQTIPYLFEYRLAALRDAVVWGYAIFAFAVSSAMLRTRVLNRAVVGYSLVLPWFLLWAPIGLWLSQTSSAWGLTVPGSPHVDLIFLKPGDVAVHLAGIAVFMALGLHTFGRRASDVGFMSKEWLWWVLWLAAFVFSASLSRGGMLAILVAGGVAVALRPSARWIKVALVGLVIGSVLLVANIEFETKRLRRASPQQIVANIVSIVGDSPREGLEGTRRWREEWWSDIIDYTVRGPYFWLGKGYGINLAIDDGIISAGSTEAARLRSPHSAHLTILARSGVPGFLLWSILNVAFVWALLRAYYRARHWGYEWWARLNVWILAYWAAFLVNMSFDVYLEGPQGGIWFWSLIGFGIAAIEWQRRGLVSRAERSSVGRTVTTKKVT